MILVLVADTETRFRSHNRIQSHLPNDLPGELLGSNKQSSNNYSGQDKVADTKHNEEVPANEGNDVQDLVDVDCYKLDLDSEGEVEEGNCETFGRR